jgi:hypothetical protein
MSDSHVEIGAWQLKEIIVVAWGLQPGGPLPGPHDARASPLVVQSTQESQLAWHWGTILGKIQEGDCNETDGPSITLYPGSAVLVAVQVSVGVPVYHTYSCSVPVVLYVVTGNRPLKTVVVIKVHTVDVEIHLLPSVLVKVYVDSEFDVHLCTGQSFADQNWLHWFQQSPDRVRDLFSHTGGVVGSSIG